MKPLPVATAGALPAGSVSAKPRVNPTDGGVVVSIAGGSAGTGPQTAALSQSVVGPAPVARAALVASAALPAAGAYTSTTTTAVPPGARRVTFYITYTRGASGGYAQHTFWAGNGTETGQVLAPDATFSAASGVVPSSGTAVVYNFSMELGGGETTVGIASAEAGATSSPGTSAVAVTFG